jgi:hypothetical protein
MGSKASDRQIYATVKAEYHRIGTKLFKEGHGGMTPKEYAKAQRKKKGGKKRAKKRSKK